MSQRWENFLCAILLIMANFGWDVPYYTDIKPYFIHKTRDNDFWLFQRGSWVNYTNATYNKSTLLSPLPHNCPIAYSLDKLLLKKRGEAAKLGGDTAALPNQHKLLPLLIYLNSKILIKQEEQDPPLRIVLCINWVGMRRLCQLGNEFMFKHQGIKISKLNLILPSHRRQSILPP